MNIHIKDEKVYEALKNASLASCEFGSTLYRTNDSLSDKDLHYIYATSNPELNSFLKSHHHLQYKEEGIDSIFVNLHTFLHNLIKGDSTVLFEIVHSDSFKGTQLEFLHNMKDSFINYAIVRSYLGFARRDIQHYHKKETHREQLKALCHIWRGYFFADSLMNGDFILINEKFLQMATEIKAISILDNASKKSFLQAGQTSVTNLREELNRKFNNNLLGMPKYMSVENQLLLDTNIKALTDTNEWKSKQNYLNNFDMNPFYNAFENEITY